MKLNPYKTIENLKRILIKEPMLFNLNSKDKDIVIVGDMHSDVKTLNKILKKYSKDNILVFLGDYVDRPNKVGDSLKVINLIANAKIKNPKNIILLRGDHEFERVNIKYGFYNDCLEIGGSSRLWYDWNVVFSQMPLAVLINNNILVLHGGIPNIKKINEINKIPKGLQMEQNNCLDMIMWTDYLPNIKSVQESPRGVKNVFIYDEDNFNKSMQKLNLEILIRGHQPAVKGFIFNNKCITLISAERYIDKPGETLPNCNLMNGILIAKIFKNNNKIQVLRIKCNKSK